jgi:uncharacterized membrane protein YfcA
VRELLASPLGFLIGISLGAFGGGGSILAVPALVYAAGQSATSATSTSLVVVALTALVGVVPHWRAGRVRFGAGSLFGLAGVGGSLVGTHLNASADPDALLVAFSVLMLVAAAAMWRRNAGTVVMAADRHAVGAASLIRDAPVSPAVVVKVIAAGSVVGLLTGFFGVGGGFVVVPALVLALRFDMPDAVGTSLLVIAINSVVALASRWQGGSIEWGTAVPFAVAGVAGVAVGVRLASTRDSSSLQKGFIALLVVVAVYTGVRSGVSLL